MLQSEGIAHKRVHYYIIIIITTEIKDSLPRGVGDGRDVVDGHLRAVAAHLDGVVEDGDVASHLEAEAGRYERVFLRHWTVGKLDVHLQIQRVVVARDVLASVRHTCGQNRRPVEDGEKARDAIHSQPNHPGNRLTRPPTVRSRPSCHWIKAHEKCTLTAFRDTFLVVKRGE